VLLLNLICLTYKYVKRCNSRNLVQFYREKVLQLMLQYLTHVILGIGLMNTHRSVNVILVIIMLYVVMDQADMCTSG